MGTLAIGIILFKFYCVPICFSVVAIMITCVHVYICKGDVNFTEIKELNWFVIDKLFFVLTYMPLNCYMKSGRKIEIFNSEYKYKERVALNRCLWYFGAGALLASITYGSTNSSFSDLENNSRNFKWNCLDICSVDDDVSHILEEKIARNLGDGWIDVDLGSALDKMNETMFLKKLQYHNVYDGLIEEIKAYFFNETKYKIPFMKMKVEECTKKPLAAGALSYMIHVLWGMLFICIIQT